MSRLPAARYPEVRQLMESAYGPYTLVQFDRLFYGGNYFVLEAGGEIVAGVQANPVRWRLVSMPGLSGKLIMHVVPHLPVMGRLIQPDRYAFAALEALYVRPGHGRHCLRCWRAYWPPSASPRPCSWPTYTTRWRRD